jgi:hypothetical protein
MGGGLTEKFLVLLSKGQRNQAFLKHTLLPFSSHFMKQKLAVTQSPTLCNLLGHLSIRLLSSQIL